MLSDLLPINAKDWEQVIECHPLTLSPETSLMQALQHFQQQGSTVTGAFVVTNGQLIGVLNTQIILRLVSLGIDLHQITVGETMVQPALTLNPADLQDVSILAYLQTQAADGVAIVNEQMHFLGAICPDRLQAYLRSNAVKWQHQVAQLQAENECLRRLHPTNSGSPSVNPAENSFNAARQIVLETIPDLMIRMTGEGVYIDFLPARNCKTIMPSSNMIGKAIFEVLPQTMANERMHYVKLALQTGETQIYEYEIIIDGIQSYQEVRITPSGADEVVVMVRDISDRKQRESQLEQTKVDLFQARANLEVQVKEHSTALEVANQRLQYEIAERKRIEQVLRENQIYLRIINKIAACLTSSSSIEHIIETTIEQLRKYFKTLRVAYFVLDEDNIISLIHQAQPANFSPITIDTDMSAATEWVNALRQFEPVIVEDISQASILASQKESLLAEKVQAVLDIPLKHSNTEIGILSFESAEPRRWSEYEIATLIEIANYLSLVLQEANTQKLCEWIEAALLQSRQTNALLATALEKAGDAIEITNADLMIEYVNPAWEKMTGYSRTEAIGKNPGTLLQGHEHDEALTRQIEATIATGQVWRGKGTAHRPDGTLFHQDITISPVFNAIGQIEHYVAVRRDVTLRQQAEEQLQSANDEMAALFAAMTDLIQVFDDQGRCLKTPTQPTSLFGSANDCIGKTLHDTFSPDLADYFLACIHQCLRSCQTLNVEYSLTLENHQTRWFDANISPINENTVIWVSRDTTERKQAEEQLKTSLHEKELLLKEVHHRVKNNMQVISSIFSLQSQHTTDPDTLTILADSQNRIRSMALIHEKLYQSNSLAKIDFADYVRSLMQNLFSTHRDQANKVQLNLDISDVPLNIDTAIPCGLILNELVSNSLKHAFKEKQSGEIMITFMNSTQEHVHLVVKDNGTGLPSNLNIYQTDSLGLRLIRALSRQLNGKWELYNNGGTVFTIVFPRFVER
ncbi:PAS domain S-box protein [Oscillatoria sp. FACHB-1407]|uniref:PAS domain S-box protein n=1 Tax=Oscillatoria sp. FACHB-1407 TaxID=2692847 RepID=UPI001682B8E2|nr:PAS domain S-box protein [Oscillatoria sp. FACHB-1407]MBD2461352.1 PAS domain S-box protein [Oscillatoria sp. FACHB-1407]